MEWHPYPTEPFTWLMVMLNFLFAAIFNIKALMKLGRHPFELLPRHVERVRLLLRRFHRREFALRAHQLCRQCSSWHLYDAHLPRGSVVQGRPVPGAFHPEACQRFLHHVHVDVPLHCPRHEPVCQGAPHGCQFSWRGQLIQRAREVRNRQAWNQIMHALSKKRFYVESYRDVASVENFVITAENFESLDVDSDGVDDPTECGTVMAYFYFITYTVAFVF